MKNIKFIAESNFSNFDLVYGEFPEAYHRHKNACILKSMLLYTSLIKHKNSMNDIETIIFAVKDGKVICSVTGPMGGLLERFFLKMETLKYNHTRYAIGCTFEFGPNDLELLGKNLKYISGIICPPMFDYVLEFIKNKNPRMYILTSKLVSRQFESFGLVSVKDWENVPKLRNLQKEEKYIELCQEEVLKEMHSFCK